jgi:hypothetical protein
MPELFTIGHSTHSWEKFLELLRQHRIETVADVRSSPYSQFNPHFNREPLQLALRQQGISYVFLGEELGARRSEPECYVNGRVAHKLLIEDADQDVQKWSVKYFGEYQHNEPKTRETLIAKLKQSLQRPESPPNVRTLCYQVLRTLTPVDPAVVEIAKEEIAYEAHIERGSKARRAAVTILAHASPEDKDVPRLLMNLVSVSPSAKARGIAFSLLKSNWTHVQDVQDFVSKIDSSSTPKPA